MRNLLVNERDQKSVLHEQARVEELSKTKVYCHISKEIDRGTSPCPTETRTRS